MTSLDTVAGTQMKITARSEELADILAVAGRGVSTRTSVHVLTGILLRAEGDRLAVAATDMELSLRLELDATVEEEGAVVVPGRLLVDIARLLPPGEVTLEYRPEEGVARLTCGPATYSLHTFAVEDFPRLPELEGENRFSVDRQAFLETIAKVGRSASRDESRPVLTGVLVRFEGGTLVMAATDSYRLSVKETDLPTGPGRELEAIVPARALQELARLGGAATADTIEVGSALEKDAATAKAYLDRVVADHLADLCLAPTETNRANLAAEGIASRPYFPAIHLQPFYRERFGFGPGMFPIAEKAAAEGLALPFHAQLSAGDQERIATVLSAALAAS